MARFFIGVQDFFAVNGLAPNFDVPLDKRSRAVLLETHDRPVQGVTALCGDFLFPKNLEEAW